MIPAEQQLNVFLKRRRNSVDAASKTILSLKLGGQHCKQSRVLPTCMHWLFEIPHLSDITFGR